MSEFKQLQPGTVITGPQGSYTIIRTLGSGGFGVTYLVETTLMVGNIPVAAKFALKEHFMSDLCERGADTRQVTYSEPVGATVERAKKAFIREATRLQSLGVDHPNIVRINEVFEANNTAYYVMEYLDGETLSQYIKRNGPMDAIQALGIMQPVIDAVATLHEQNITHYDIKPANIMLATGSQGKVRPVLIDFGLSKHYDDDGTDTSTNKAPGYTPGYSPIEQYAGLHEFTPQADVYALAATLYTCLTGQKPPVASGSNAATMTARIADKVDQSVANAMQSALQFDKDLRTRDAVELYGQLYQGKQPLPPVPPVEENTRIADDGRTTFAPSSDETHRTSSVPNTPPVPPVNSVPPVIDNVPPIQSDEYTPDGYEKRSGSKKWIWIVLIILLALGGSFAAYYFKNKKKNSPISSETETTQEQYNSYGGYNNYGEGEYTAGNTEGEYYNKTDEVEYGLSYSDMDTEALAESLIDVAKEYKMAYDDTAKNVAINNALAIFWAIASRDRESIEEFSYHVNKLLTDYNTMEAWNALGSDENFLRGFEAEIAPILAAKFNEEQPVVLE